MTLKLLIRSCYARCGVVALLPHLIHQRICSYALYTFTTVQLRSFRGALYLRLCCTLKMILCRSAEKGGSAAVDDQPSNKTDNIPVAMIKPVASFSSSCSSCYSNSAEASVRCSGWSELANLSGNMCNVCNPIHLAPLVILADQIQLRLLFGVLDGTGLAHLSGNMCNVCNPVLVTTFPEWLSDTVSCPRTLGAVRPSSLCL